MVVVIGMDDVGIGVGWFDVGYVVGCVGVVV